LSHQQKGHPNRRHLYANFLNFDDILNKFDQLTAEINNIDIFVYNSAHGTYPIHPSHYKSNTKVNPEGWYDTINIHAIIPHMLTIRALSKMSNTSKIVFLVTGLAINFIDRIRHTRLVGYAAGKAAQIFLMLALANHNDRGTIVTALSPHFDLEDIEFYQQALDHSYQYILKMDPAQNGHIEQLPGPREL
jgi:NAD(P)-dependent dehydrogenase (short-subunit alcohol dehydrogenase family)